VEEGVVVVASSPLPWRKDARRRIVVQQGRAAHGRGGRQQPRVCSRVLLRE
jgi:hypothetical protein